MIDSFPYEEWSEDISAFWTFGPGSSTGTYIMTVLGITAHGRLAHRLGVAREQEADRPGRAPARRGRHARPGRDPAGTRDRPNRRSPARPPTPATRGGSRWATARSISRRCRSTIGSLHPFMWTLSIVCIVIVAIIVSTDKNGPFIGPWG